MINSLNNNQYSIGVLIDLKKAVDHDVLAKTYFYGVRGIAKSGL